MLDFRKSSINSALRKVLKRFHYPACRWALSIGFDPSKPLHVFLLKRQLPALVPKLSFTHTIASAFLIDGVTQRCDTSSKQSILTDRHNRGFSVELGLVVVIPLIASSKSAHAPHAL
jgi:hypothetical protein